MSEEMPNCPKCESDMIYQDGALFICPMCAHEWGVNDTKSGDDDEFKVVDANGNILVEGDTVVVIKDLKVKGASNPIKQGTIVKNIHLIDEAGHNIACKISGFGAMNLKSEFVKKSV